MKNLRRKAPSPIAPAEAGEEAAMTHNPNSERTADLVPRSTRRAITVARLILALPAPVTFFSWLLTSLDGPKAQRGLVGSFFYYELSWSNPLHWMSVWLGANMYVASILLQSFGKRPEIQQIDVVGTEKIFTWDAITELAIYVTFTIMSSMINMIHPSPESKVPPQRSTDLLIGTFAAAGAGCLALYLFIKTIINTKRERLSATAFRAWTVKQAGVLVFGICPFVLVCNSYAAIVMDHVPMLYFHATPNHNIFEEHASTLVCTNESVALAAIANIPDCVSSPHLFCRYDSWQTLCERIHVSEGARAAQIFILWAPLHVTLMWSVITLYSHGIATKRDTGESRSSYVHLFQPHMLLVGLLLLYVNLMLLYMLPQFLVLGQFLMSDHRIDEIIEPPGVCYGRCNDMVRNASFMACWGVIVLILNFDRFRGILREKGDKRREREAIEEAERSWDPKQPTLYFLPANYVRELPADVLPRFQELRAQGHLTRMAIPLASAFRGDDLIRTVLFISHGCASAVHMCSCTPACPHAFPHSNVCVSHLEGCIPLIECH